MKIEWLIANETAVRSPARAECDIVGVILDVFWPIQAISVAEKALCDVGIPSWAL